jgi:hypothetical protein
MDYVEEYFTVPSYTEIYQEHHVPIKKIHTSVILLHTKADEVLKNNVIGRDPKTHSQPYHSVMIV